ncbi:hypothetical protein M1P97_07390 [Parabacteroides sp. GYB001]|uniref:hypothetical protein n=1 Tax=Parabacteroides leei TaxID=2939491 RepID=UPI0020179547|nr:hypothetical protein [Parabacteroides leei]MCL3851107.1 hypothetical protein [Parabacteroides leei]
MISKIYPHSSIKSIGCFSENIRKNPKIIQVILDDPLENVPETPSFIRKPINRRFAC